MKDEIKNALKLKYEGDKAAAHANIRIYLINPVGIGEHSDVLSAIDEQVAIAATSEEKLKYLEEVK